MTRRYPKQYGPDEIHWMETVFEPIWKQENRSNSISNKMIDETVDPDTVEVDSKQVKHFQDCRLMSLGGKRVTVLYHTNVDFAEAAKLLNIKENTLRRWITRLGYGLLLTGSDKKQVTRMLQKPCNVH